MDDARWHPVGGIRRVLDACRCNVALDIQHMEAPTRVAQAPAAHIDVQLRLAGSGRTPNTYVRNAASVRTQWISNVINKKGCGSSHWFFSASMPVSIMTMGSIASGLTSG